LRRQPCPTRVADRQRVLPAQPCGASPLHRPRLRPDRLRGPAPGRKALPAGGQRTSRRRRGRPLPAGPGLPDRREATGHGLPGSLRSDRGRGSRPADARQARAAGNPVDLLGAVCAALAALTLGLGLFHPGKRLSLRAWGERQVKAAAGELRAARLETSPRAFLAIKLGGPLIGAGIGWLVSPVCALVGFGVGFSAPRLYVRWLVQAQAERSEAQAPHLLQTLTAQLSAGATYLEALRQARQHSTDPWIRTDLETVLGRFLLNEPLEVALADVRLRIGGRNLGLVVDTLALCLSARVTRLRS